MMWAFITAPFIVAAIWLAVRSVRWAKKSTKGEWPNHALAEPRKLDRGLQGMTTNSNCSAMKGHLVMIGTIAAIVSVFTMIDIQISLARIDSSDSTTPVHLARPQVAYAFLPLLAAVLAAFAIVVNSVLGFFLRRRLSRAPHWAMLGAAFALISVAQPISAIGINNPLVLWFSAATALLAAIAVRWRYGERSH